MAFPAKILLIVAAAFFVAPAVASDVPTLNVRPTCTPIGNDKTFPIDTERCMKSEHEARDQLTREWAGFPAADRALCTETAKMGGMASYVALITCLEMKRDVTTRPADRALTIKPAGLPAKK